MFQKKQIDFFILFLLFVFLGCQNSGNSARVTVRKTTISILTNRELLPNDIPQFSNTGTKGAYPYPMHTNFDYTLEKREFTAVILENAFLKVTVLPDLGGHIYSAVDKISGEEMFFANPELKKSLIGLTGAWCAFGLEFNMPKRGHTPTSLLPVNFTLERHRDGSASVFLSDREYIGNLYFSVRIRLRPKTARISTETHIFNPTQFPQPLYYWTNAAVPANEKVQVIFPQPRSTTHGSPWIRSWPVENGVDLSWYKNHSGYMYSRFNRDDAESFMGYYDHGRDFGVLYWADRNHLPYRKFWSWGHTPVGKNWNKRLSDTGGDYIELQSGLFKDQETFAELPPHASLRFSEFWMPVSKTGGITHGDTTAVLNLNVSRAGDSTGLVRYGVTSFTQNKNSTLSLWQGERELKTHAITLEPGEGQKFKTEVDPKKGKIRLVLKNSKGEKRLESKEGSYKQNRDFEPGKINYYKPDSKNRSAEDFFLEARRAELSYLTPKAIATLRAGLKTFPHSFLLNLRIARLLLKTGEAAVALPHLEIAEKRTDVVPEIDYLKATAYHQLGKEARALHHWALSARMGYAPSACHYLMGAALARNQKWEMAEVHFKKSLSFSPDNPLPSQGLAWTFFRLGRKEEARTTAAGTVKKDPTQFGSLMIFPRKHPLRVRYKVFPRPSLKQWQAVAFDLAQIGEPRRAYVFLGKSEGLQQNPMFHYTLAWLANQAGLPFDHHLDHAGKHSIERVFPHTLAESKVLSFAAEHLSENGTVRHLQGVLAASFGKSDTAISLLGETNTQNQPYYSLLVRGILEENFKTLAGAEKTFRAALQKNRKGQYAALRLSDLSAKMGVPARKRLKILEGTREHVGTEAIEQLDKAIVLTKIEAGQFHDAAGAMKAREFHTWEGRAGMRALWWNNHLLWARVLEKKGGYLKALEKIETALNFPKNLNAEEGDFGLEGFETFYLKGRLLARMGKMKASREAFKKSAGWKGYQSGNRNEPISYHLLYKALALGKLNRSQEKQALLKKIQARSASGNLSTLAAAGLKKMQGKITASNTVSRKHLSTNPPSTTTVLLKAHLQGQLFN